MDPNKLLSVFRAAAIRWKDHYDRAVELDDKSLFGKASSAYELADDEMRKAFEAAQDLDEWLSKGGFVPDAWKGE